MKINNYKKINKSVDIKKMNEKEEVENIIYLNNFYKNNIFFRLKNKIILD
jgi:hypothetical protein